MSGHKAAAPEKTEGHGEEKPKSGGKSKLLIGAFVSAVIMVETAVFLILVPSGEDVAALAESRLIEAVKQKEAESHAADEVVVAAMEEGMVAVTAVVTAPKKPAQKMAKRSSSMNSAITG